MPSLFFESAKKTESPSFTSVLLTDDANKLAERFSYLAKIFDFTDEAIALGAKVIGAT
jgi:hypothetical protein